MRPFLEKSLEHVLTSQQNFSEIIQCLRNVLTNDTVQEANKQVISELICNNVERVSNNVEAFSIYMHCILSLPEKQVEQISSLKKYSNTSMAQFKMCVKIRCAVIAELLSKVPLDLIKEFFYFVNIET